MACPQQQFSSQSTIHEAVSTPASTTSSSSASLFSASFSVFQEGPGQPLVFSPPLHTPELQALVDRYLALDVPIQMKMDMLRCDFEAHVARTNERYKTYFVPAASPAAVAAVPSPPVFTASPAPLLFTPHEASAGGSLSSASSSDGNGSGSGSGSFLFDTPSVQRPQQLRPSPTESPVLASTASSSVYPFSVPMFPSTTDYSAFYCDAASAGLVYTPSTVAHASTPSTGTPSPRSARGALRPSRGLAQRRHLTDDSLQIVTRTGENVTNVSSRATRTHEDRENTRLVRQRGACPDCRRKKQRCAPGHAGATLDRGVAAPRPAAPYTAPAQSGRAKQEAAAAQAARAARDKVEGKRPEVLSEQQPVVFDGAAWARNSPLPSSISPADDLSLVDSLLDWGDLDTTENLLFFSSAATEDLFAASTDTALADVRPPMAAAHGQSLYYATQRLPTTMRPLAPLHPRTQRPTSSLANVSNSTQLSASRDELHASRGELQFSVDRLQASGALAARVERSAHSAVSEAGTSTSVAGGAPSAACDGTGVSRNSPSSHHDTVASRTTRSLLQSNSAEVEVGSSSAAVSSAPISSPAVQPIVYSSDTEANVCPGVQAIVYSSDAGSGISSDANPLVFSSDANSNVSSGVQAIVYSSGASSDVSADVNPIVFSSDANSDVSSDVQAIVYSTEASSDVSANVNPLVCSSDANSDVSSDVNPTVFSSDASSLENCSSDQKPENSPEVQTAAVAAAEVLLVLATMTSVAECLLPALALWSAAHASDALATDLGNELERMHLGASSAACQ